MKRRPEPLFELRPVLGCFIQNCPCAREPRYHFEYEGETREERDQRIQKARNEWTAGQ